MSIAGGLHLSFQRGEEAGCEVIQIFTKNATQWKARPIQLLDRKAFLRQWKESSIRSVVAHDSYLVNLASPDPNMWRKSRVALMEEVKRAEILEIPFLIMHPGSHRGRGEEYGIRQVAEGLNRIFQEREGSKIRILLESTAGQGDTVGYRFEHLRRIMDEVEQKGRIGVCFDTCHVFAAGYDLRGRKNFARVFQEFDSVVGIEHLLVFHLNDSKGGLGKRIDRHEHIGKGAMGTEPFRMLLCHDRFREIPMLIETPKGGRSNRWDRKNLALLKKFREEKGRRIGLKRAKGGDRIFPSF